MVFAEATQYPPRDHCLLCCRCALVFMGGGKKSGLPTVLFVGRAFCSLPDTAFQPHQDLVLLFLGFRNRVFTLDFLSSPSLSIFLWGRRGRISWREILDPTCLRAFRCFCCTGLLSPSFLEFL